MRAGGSRWAWRSGIDHMNTVLSLDHVFLARHGETAWSRDGRYQGRSDPPLSSYGVAQALQLAEVMRAKNIASVVASPLRRARQTAAIVAKALRLDPPAIDPDLIEIAYGAWEGLNQPEVKSRWPALLRTWKRAPLTVGFPEGETLINVQSRVQTALASRLRPEGSPPILLVGHSVWIRLALVHACGLSAEDFRRIGCATGAAVRLCRDDPVTLSKELR